VKAITKRLTYANVMSSIAVFLVLGGATAFAAAQLGKNSVGTKQLKKNAVTTAKIKKNAINGAKIKKNAITTAKVKNGAITGAKVNTSTLGTVPSASTYSGYSRTGLIKASATAGASEAAAYAAAPEIPLISAGPFTVYGKCVLYGTDVEGTAFIRTTAAGSILDSDEDDYAGDPFLEPSTAELDRKLINENVSNNAAEIYAVHSSEFFAAAPEGTVFRGDIGLSVKQGTLPGGDGLYGPGNVCLFNAEGTQLNQ